MINDVHKHRMAIFSCEATRYFAEKVVAAMNRLKRPDEPEVVLGSLEVAHFSDGEFQPSYAEVSAVRPVSSSNPPSRPPTT